MGLVTHDVSYWQADHEDVIFLEATVGDLLDAWAREQPEQEALVFASSLEQGDQQDHRWTYRQLQEQANAVARGLMALGLQKGDHIAVWATNCPEWLLLLMGAVKTGLVLVPINPALRTNELEYVLKQGDIRALFFLRQAREHDCLATVRSLTIPAGSNGRVSGDQLPLLRYVCLLESTPVQLHEGWRPALLAECIAEGTRVSEIARRARQTEVCFSDTALILYTSGTTGFPKGAILSQYSLINGALLLSKRLPVVPHVRLCLPIPFFHILGLHAALLCFLQGGTLQTFSVFKPITTMQIIQQASCSCLISVPTILTAMMQHPEVGHYDLSSLRWIICSGAPVPLTLLECIHERLGIDVCVPFGQTEAGACITQTSPDDPFKVKVNTVGLPAASTEVKVIAPQTGQIVAIGVCGEICCHSPLIMQGYYHMPEQTSQAIDADGWLHTGDLGVMDERGYVTLAGRLKDMIIRGGENIYPREVEAFLCHHPEVEAVQVVGIPDAFFGEELLAAIIPKAGVCPTEESLRAYCQGRICHQKIPRYFQVVEAYPLTASGKVQKFRLREQAIQMLGLEKL